MTERRLVNLTDLADLMEMSLPTLRTLIRKNDDFPVETTGQHGVPYEFNVDSVRAWWDGHQAAIAAEKQTASEQLEMYRREWFGDAPDPTMVGLSPTERKAEIEARIREDQLRRNRGELLARVEVDRLLRKAFVNLQKGIRQIGPDLARHHDLPREVRMALEASLRDRFNGLIDATQAVMQAEDADGDARVA